MTNNRRDVKHTVKQQVRKTVILKRVEHNTTCW